MSHWIETSHQDPSNGRAKGSPHQENPGKFHGVSVVRLNRNHSRVGPRPFRCCVPNAIRYYSTSCSRSRIFGFDPVPRQSLFDHKEAFRGFGPQAGVLIVIRCGGNCLKLPDVVGPGSVINRIGLIFRTNDACRPIAIFRLPPGPYEIRQMSFPAAPNSLSACDLIAQNRDFDGTLGADQSLNALFSG